MVLRDGGGSTKSSGTAKKTLSLQSAIQAANRPVTNSVSKSSMGYGKSQNTGRTASYSSPAPVQQSSPAPQPYVDGGGGGGGLPYGGGGSLAPMVQAPSEEDYLAGDSGYQTQISALAGALQRFLADAEFQRGNYNTDYNKALRDLGYDEGTKEWDWNDRLTASGAGYQNQLDDFAARGMLQSQGYADAYENLQRMLGQQYDALSGAKNTFMRDLDAQTANFKAENTANKQAARAEALQRMAAGFAL